MPEHYELLFIIPGSQEESAVPQIKDKVVELVTKQGAKITLDQSFENRKLAYKILQETRGYYWLLEFDAEKSSVAEIRNQLNLMPEVLRFLLLQARIKTAEELAAEETLKAKIRARQTEEVKQELTDAVKKEEKEKVEAFAPKPVVEEKDKISMEDLDKKLEEILGDDIKI